MLKNLKKLEGCQYWETEWHEVFNNTHLTKKQHHIFVLTKKWWTDNKDPVSIAGGPGRRGNLEESSPDQTVDIQSCKWSVRPTQPLKKLPENQCALDLDLSNWFGLTSRGTSFKSQAKDKADGSSQIRNSLNSWELKASRSMRLPCQSTLNNIWSPRAFPSLKRSKFVLHSPVSIALQHVMTFQISKNWQVKVFK